MTRPLLALLLALALAVAGCLGGATDDAVDADDRADAGDEPEAPDEEEPPAGDDGDDAGGEDPPENRAPVAQLAASLTSGTAPLEVIFTVDGSDEDGDALAWSLDLGDGSEPVTGDAVPAEPVALYGAAGNHTAVLTVSDGEASDTAEVTIRVQAPLPTPNAVQNGSNSLCLDYLALWLVDGTHSPLGNETELVVTEPGTGFVITASGEGIPFIDFYDAEGAYLDSGGANGVVPAGSAYGFVCVLVAGLPEGLPTGVPDPQGEFAYQDGF